MKILTFILFITPFILSKKVEQILTIEKMFNCPDRVAQNPNLENTYNTIRNVSFKKYKYIQVANGFMYINAPLKKMPTDIVLKRCDSSEESSCENFIKMKFNDLCPLFLEKGQVHTPFAEAFHPPIKCPLIKGTLFTITNATIDSGKALKILAYVPNVYNYNWVLRFMGKTPANVEIWCQDLWFKFYEIKVRKS